MVEESTHKHKIRSVWGKIIQGKDKQDFAPQLIRITQWGDKLSYKVKIADGIGPQEIFQSLNLEQNKEAILKSKESMGKSGSFFFFSYDRRFIVKTLKTEEVPTLKKMMLKLYNHVNERSYNPGSLLSKIYGLYEIKIEGFESIPIIIMENAVH